MGGSSCLWSNLLEISFLFDSSDQYDWNVSNDDFCFLLECYSGYHGDPSIRRGPRQWFGGHCVIFHGGRAPQNSVSCRNDLISGFH